MDPINEYKSIEESKSAAESFRFNNQKEFDIEGNSKPTDLSLIGSPKVSGSENNRPDTSASKASRKSNRYDNPMKGLDFDFE